MVSVAVCFKEQGFEATAQRLLGGRADVAADDRHPHPGRHASSGRPVRVCARATLAAMLGVLAAVGAGSVRAQVLEIGEGGEVSVYNGPAVFTADGATPFARPAPRPQATDKAPQGVREAIHQAATATALSPALIEAVAWQESRFRHGAVSRAGALGEMQLMPGTALALGVDPLDSRQNFGGGAAYLRWLIQRYDGDLELALAAYDAGPKAVDHYRGMPPFKETRAYVAAILARLGREAAAMSPEGYER
jgi:hypothetical protein